MLRTCVLLVLLLARPTFADPLTLRLKLRPSTGELVTSDKPCGKTIQAEVWRRLSESPWVEIIDDAMRGATRNTPGDPFIGEYAFQDKIYMVTVTPPKSRRQRSTRVSFAIVYTMSVARETCFERWVGLGDQW